MTFTKIQLLEQELEGIKQQLASLVSVQLLSSDDQLLSRPKMQKMSQGISSFKSQGRSEYTAGTAEESKGETTVSTLPAPSAPPVGLPNNLPTPPGGLPAPPSGLLKAPSALPQVPLPPPPTGSNSSNPSAAASSTQPVRLPPPPVRADMTKILAASKNKKLRHVVPGSSR